MDIWYDAARYQLSEERYPRLSDGVSRITTVAYDNEKAMIEVLFSHMGECLYGVATYEYTGEWLFIPNMCESIFRRLIEGFCKVEQGTANPYIQKIVQSLGS